MNKGPGVTPLHGSGVGDAHQRRLTTSRIMEVAATHSLHFFESTFQRMFDGIDDAFFDLANHAHSNNEQNLFFEAMRDVRLKRRQIVDAFLHKVAELFRQPPDAGGHERKAEQDPQEQPLSLVDHAELEEEVAMTTLTSKLRANLSGELLAFQARYSWLYAGGREATRQVNPLDPGLLCEAFAEACAILDMPVREKLIVFKQFDKQVMSLMGQLLDDLNNRLTASGVLPTFRPGVKRSDSGRAAAATSAAAEEPMTGAGADTATSGRSAAEASSQALLSELVHALHLAIQNQHLAYEFRPTTPDAIVLDAHDLIHLLSGLQDNGSVSPDSEPVSPDTVRERLRTSLQGRKESSGREHALRENDEDLINLVSMLFEFILNDYSLSPPIQVLISRLQIPILKVAIADRDFFGRSNHPARRLLNALARAGIGWADASEQARDKLYQEIHRVVETIINQFDGDITLFEQLLEEFQAFQAREEKRARIVEARTREAENGRLLSRKARRLADAFIADRIKAQPLPPAALELFRDGWSKVLFLAYLKEGEAGFKAAARWVDELIWCLKPHAHESERKLWVKLVPALLRECRLKLADTGFSSIRLKNLLADLKTVLTDTFKQQSALAAQEAGVNETPSTPPRPEVKPVLTAIEREARKEDAALAKFTAQVDALPLNTWVDFEMLNGTHVRCKLSARLDEGSTLIFVNRMGLKTLEKTREEMAQALRRNHVRVLESGALMDRALNAVAERLRAKAA
ncbi:MAG: DUF1631 domain-containing protein [Gammaproteobacteria bacterium]|nr:MAG: DUF1631 domain-containing protein [Gammaproteobacteria bacterium]